MQQNGKSQTLFTGRLDVLVVGGGGSGLAAAVAAADAGARVGLIEKATRVGGTTALAVGSIAAAGTSMQRAVGIEDSPERHFADVEAVVAGRPGQENVALRRLLIDEAATSVEWLHRLGVEFYGPNPWPGTSAPRMHNALPNARAYVEVLRRAAEKRGVQIRTGVAAKELLCDERGAIVGVVATSKGASPEIRCPTVVLATGYFHGDLELRARFIGPESVAVDAIEPNQTGDGHRMTMAVGAPMVNMGVGSAPEFRFVTRTDRILARRLPVHPLATRAMRMGMRFVPRPLFLRFVKDLLTGYTAPSTKLFEKGAILVNRDGRRFANELVDFSYSVAAQQDKVAYLVFDDSVARQFAAYPNVISTAPGIAYAYLPDYRRLRPDIYHVGRTLQDAATRAGLPTEELERTVAAYNQAVRVGGPDEFGRTDLGSGVATPPFHVMGPAKSYFVDSQGGPAVDTSCHVLDAAGRPIPHLYAVGALAKASLLYGGAGFDLAWVFTSARIAGRSAAIEALAIATAASL